MNGRTRTGKIARLPEKTRDELNRRLQDGEQGKALVVWLNSLPEVQAVLEAEFGKRRISEKNMSDWTQGGYRDWQLRQDVIEAVRRMEADASELGEASEEPIINTLLKGLAARYAVAAHALTRSDGKGELDVPLLHQLCRDVIALRRSDDYAERVQVERDRVNIESDHDHGTRDDKMLEWAWSHRELVLSHIRTRLRDQELSYLAAINGTRDDDQAGEQADRVEALTSAVKHADAGTAGKNVA